MSIWSEKDNILVITVNIIFHCTVVSEKENILPCHEVTLPLAIISIRGFSKSFSSKLRNSAAKVSHQVTLIFFLYERYNRQ